MARNQTFIPMLSYERGVEALAWLATVFGMTEGARMIDEDGNLSHGELELDGQVIMLATPNAAYQSPGTVAKNYPRAAQWLDNPYVINGVMVYVADLDATRIRAIAAGARILSEIEEGFPGRRFRIEDPEGHRWFVFQRE